MTPPLAVTEWVLQAGSTEAAVEMAARTGFRAIELAANPELCARSVRRCLDSAGMAVTSLCGMYDPTRDCAHPDAAPRRRAQDYLRRSLDLAAELGAGAVICVPTYRVDDDVDRGAELANAAETIAGVLEGGIHEGPLLVLEALNRYETHLVRTLAEAEALRRMIGSSQVRLMADVFHMNIEEDSIIEALRQHAEHLAHVHLADSQRRDPGSGHLDFAAIMATLDDIGYGGTMALEFMPVSEPALVAGRLAVEDAIARRD